MAWMFGLVVGVFLCDLPAPDPSELVKRLASPRYLERESAMAALVELGSTALPALQAAGLDADLEVRARAATLHRKILASVPGHAAILSLDSEPRTLQEWFDAISERSPNRLAWSPANAIAFPPERKFALRSSKPLSFWETVDLLCDQEGLHYVPDMQGRSPKNMFRLFLAPGIQRKVRSDYGPLRIEIDRVVEVRDINCTPIHPVHLVDDSLPVLPTPYGERIASLELEFCLLVEPRLMIQRFGDVLVTEAVDDRGQSLLKAGLPHVCAGGWTWRQVTSVVHHLKMHLPSPVLPVRKIQRLRFSVPIEVVTRKAEPLVMRLTEGEGRSTRSGQTTIELVQLDRKTEPRFPKVELRLSTAERTPAELTLGAGVDAHRDDSATRPVRPEVTANVLQIFDAEGRQFPRYRENDTDDPRGGVRLEIHLDGTGNRSVPEPTVRGNVRPLPGGAAAAPVELHYYEYVRAVVRAEFEFQNIPMP